MIYIYRIVVRFSAAWTVNMTCERYFNYNPENVDNTHHKSKMLDKFGEILGNCSHTFVIL